MYTAREIFNREDYEYCKHYTEKLENWTLVKKPHKKCEVTLSGRQNFWTDGEYYEIWNGKDYLMYFDELHNLPNNWGGCSWATEKTDWLENYDAFVDYLERICKHIPGYDAENAEFQMTLF